MDKKTDEIPFSPRSWPFFYGWWILVVGTLGVVMSVPGQTIGVSAFTEPMMGALALERTQFSLAYMLGTISSAFILTFAGRFYDRFGARVTAASAAVGLGTVLVYLSQIDHVADGASSVIGFVSPSIIALAVVGVGFFLLRFFGQGVMTMASSNMVQKWFDVRRGLATGIMNVFVPLAFSMGPPGFNALITHVGWSRAWLIIAAVVGMGFSLLVLVFFRDNPEDSGLQPDGVSVEKAETSREGRDRDFTLPQARRTFTFWVFNLALAMNAFYITALTFHIESIFKQVNRSQEAAYSIFLPMSIVGVSLGFLAGWISDHIKLKYLLTVMTIGMIVSMTGVLLLATPGGYVMLIAGNGMAQGMFGLLMAVTWPHFFGRTHLGAITGFMRSWTVFFSATGPFLFSLSLDYLGSYRSGVALCLGVVGILFACSLWADKPPHPEAEGATETAG